MGFLHLTWPACITGVLYVYQGALMLTKGDVPFAIMWFCYAGAQVGLIWMAAR